MKKFNLAKWLVNELKEKGFELSDILMVSDLHQENVFSLSHLLKTIDVDITLQDSSEDSNEQTYVGEFNLHMHDGSLVIYRPDIDNYDYTVYCNNLTFYLSPQHLGKDLTSPKLVLALSKDNDDEFYNGSDNLGDFLSPEYENVITVDLKRTHEITGQYIFRDSVNGQVVAQYDSINERFMVNTFWLTNEDIKSLVHFTSTLPAHADDPEFMEQLNQAFSNVE